MTSFVLNSDAQNAVNTALQQGPGANNANYIAAYNAIYANLQNSPGPINSGVLSWFSLAGTINGQASNPSPAGTWIWNYTQAAGAAQDANITYDMLQNASNKIASNVFQTLSDSNFAFDDQDNFSIQSIVQNDAGAGLNSIRANFPGLTLSNAIWGGTLFATTQLNDPTYYQDYGIQLTPGSQDCKSIEQGFLVASAAELAQGYLSAGAANLTNLDVGTVGACLKTSSLDGSSQYAALDPSTAPGASAFLGSATVAADPGPQVINETTPGDVSAIQTQFDVNNNQPWSSVNSFLNSGGQTYKQVVNNNDGTTTTDIYDLSNGQVGQQDYLATNGVLTMSDYDTRGVQSWFSVDKLYNPAGQETEQTVYNRTNSVTQEFIDTNTDQAQTVNYYASGTTTSYTYDTEGNQPWSSTVQFYDASNVRTQQTVYNNDGSITLQDFQYGTSNVSQLDYFGTSGLETVYTYNVAGNQPWSSVVQLYDSAGQELQQNVNNNDGSTTLEYFDTQNGQVSSTDYTAADGYKTVSQYDTENNQEWTSVTQLSNPYGQQTEEDVFNDDGSKTTSYYDPSTAQVTSQDYHGTDGSVDTTTYDVAGNQPWSSVDQTFSGGQQTSETVNLNAGGYDYFAYSNGTPVEEDQHSASGTDNYVPVNGQNDPIPGDPTAPVDPTPVYDPPPEPPAVPETPAAPDPVASAPTGADPITDPYPTGGYDDPFGGDDSFDDPVVLNLQHGPVTTTALSTSQAFFDQSGKGTLNQTGWLSGSEGFLVSDPTDAPITTGKQLIGSLAALSAYDTNGDGVISAADKDFADLGVWVSSSAGNNGSLTSLAVLGITQISLNGKQVNQADNGNTILSTFQTTYNDGSVGQGAAVSLAASTDPNTRTRVDLAPLIQAIASFVPSGGTAILPAQPPAPPPTPVLATAH